MPGSGGKIDVYVGSLPPGLGLSIVQENALTGTSLPAITNAGDTDNVGFAREFSIQAGGTQSFSCHGTNTVIDVYRVGWYGGSGARLVAGSISNTAATQPNPTTIASSNGATTCTAWSTTATWAVPADATSGLYVAVYRNTGNTSRFWIPFVVRRDDRAAGVMVKTADATWALAYNHYGTQANPLGGKSLYGSYDSSGNTSFDAANRVHAATYHRPIVTRHRHNLTYWMNAEAPMIRWLERNGYDITYSASKDWRAAPSAPTLASCPILLSSGHDEYWSVGTRSAWVAAQAAGKHTLHFAGNDVFWRIRYGDELSQGGDGNTAYCFKDTLPGPGGHSAGVALDPVSWTGTWKDTRSANNATRAAENTLTGTDFRMNYPGFSYALVMNQSSTLLDHPFWRGTTAPTSGLNVTDIIGFEANEYAPTAPSGSYSRLTQTVIAISGALADANGEVYTLSGNLDHGAVAQRRSSGAVVFSSGTCQWAWGLDDTHDNGGAVANTAMRQATLNLLTDLGAVAATPQGGLSVPSPVSLDNYGLVP